MQAPQTASTRAAAHGAWRLALAMLLAGWVVAVFLSHWSLLDGAPRNSLALMLQGEAQRPFAYRWLMPAIVNLVQAWLPAAWPQWLGNEVAPFFLAHYALPLAAAHEAQLPGVGAQVLLQWQSLEYRASYVLMVLLIWLCFTAALLLAAACTRQLGASARMQTGIMLVYAVIYPCSFLHGGYFYDFGEQALAWALIYLALVQRWQAFALCLMLMQCNRETALLMPVLLAPLLWAQRASLRLPRNGFSLGLGWALSLVILFATRQYFAHLPGASAEHSLLANLAFWAEPAHWLATSDIYAIGLPVPRIAFAAFIALALVFAWQRGANALVLCATWCTGWMLLLLLTLGYRDEFRAVALCLPLVLVAVAQRCVPARVFPQPPRQAATVGTDLSQPPHSHIQPELL